MSDLEPEVSNRAEAVNEVLKLAEKALELAGEAKEPFLKTELMVFAFLNIETFARAVLDGQAKLEWYQEQAADRAVRLAEAQKRIAELEAGVTRQKRHKELAVKRLAEAQKQIASLAVYREAWEQVAKCGTCIDRGEVVDHFNDLAEKHGLEKIER